MANTIVTSTFVHFVMQGSIYTAQFSTEESMRRPSNNQTLQRMHYGRFSFKGFMPATFSRDQI